MRFAKYLKKVLKKNAQSVVDMKVLDLGSGTGRNAFYFAELGASVVGIEISTTAVRLAKSRAEEAGLDITYHQQDMAKPFPVASESIDIILDVTSSNSLDETSRSIYLAECMRVLKPGGYMFLKALCKDGDENAKYLLKHSPGKEYDTYFMKDLGLCERVFSREDIVKLYTSVGFALVSLDKKTSYPKVGERVYKRNSWISVWTKK